LLKVKHVSVIAESGETTLEDISLQVEFGQLVVLIGNNGAGKTEVLNVVSGILKPTDGTIEFNGKILNGFQPHKVVKEGICHVPEGRRLFLDQTVEDNLRLGAFTMFFHESKRDIEKRIKEILAKLILLENRRRQLAGTLSGGELQILAIARALMARPKILMLDEPSLGLAPLMVKQIFEIINRLKEEGLGILLVEQVVTYAIRSCDYGYVMQQGKIVFEGEKEAFLKKSDLVKAYLA